MKDSKVAQAIKDEEIRQRTGLELIPSENYVSRDVLDALGSIFTNKYSEGYPGKRYYGGQENTDIVEQLAIDRAKDLFNSDHANVQPHSGAPANIAVYQAWLEPGDTVMAMRLDHGGHLTHGHPITSSSKLYNFVRYGIKDIETGEIDYEAMREVALREKPKIILAGFSGYPRNLDYAKFAEIGKEVNAMLMADIAHIAGLIAGKALPNPFDFGFHVMTSTTHKTLRGPRGGLILSRGRVGNPLKAPEKTIKNLPTLIDREVFPGFQGGPHMHTIAAKAIAFGEAQQIEFQEYSKQVLLNAKSLAKELIKQGFKLVTNGTDNHLIQIDMMTSYKIDGREAQDLFDSIGLTANCNAIPNDKLPPYRPSGLRIGTPAITTRGLKESDMATVAEWMKQAIASKDDPKSLSNIKQEVAEFAIQFPLPSDK
ncbi:MAG: serine hydroxymethyltransferase [Candidatus Nomurabacteria bacterium]|nr:serine hydroxymethyltransferase [Candidatus Saccharibacteria bacterium]USN95219.1 MAG: serine hydroxymethyltransferase [Candidatus Nomurabacteria bacterium]